MTPEARLLINVSVVGGSYGALIAVCIFAIWKGRTAERYGAALYGLSALLTFAVETLTGNALPTVPELFFDGMVALGFLALAIRYNNLWLGAAMMIKGGQLALHATHLTDAEDPHWGPVNLYSIGLTLISLMIVATLFGATLASLKARRRASSREELVLTRSVPEPTSV